MGKWAVRFRAWGFAIALSGAVLFSAREAGAFVLSYGTSGARSGDFEQYVRVLAEAFHREHPQARIEVRESTSYIKPILETLMQEFGESPPDLGVAGLIEWPVLHKKKLLRPLSEVLNPQEEKRVYGALTGELNAQFYGRGISSRGYALPFNRSFPVLYLNLKFLPGLKLVSPSWDDLEKALAAAPGAKLCLASSDWIWEQIISEARGKPTFQGKHAIIADPETIAVIKRLKALVEKGLVYKVADEHAAFLEFVEGKAAAMVGSFSSYYSVKNRVPFAFRISMPPRASHKSVILGGGDLILPRNPRSELDPRKRQDMRDFILWFYLGKGSALWSSLTGYLPVSRPAAQSAAYRQELSRLGEDAPVFKNSDHWKVTSFYEMDDFCNVIKLREAMQTSVGKAMESFDPGLVLKQAESFLDNLIKQPCP